MKMKALKIRKLQILLSAKSARPREGLEPDYSLAQRCFSGLIGRGSENVTNDFETSQRWRQEAPFCVRELRERPRTPAHSFFLLRMIRIALISGREIHQRRRCSASTTTSGGDLLCQEASWAPTEASALVFSAQND